jgi:hypothetical protein
MTHAATSKAENLAQGSSCKLKFVHGCTVTSHAVYSKCAYWYWHTRKLHIKKFMKLTPVARFMDSTVGYCNCLFKLVFVQARRYQVTMICHFPVNYKFVMFCSIGHGVVFTTLFPSWLIIGPNKLECLSLVSPTSLM